MRKLEKDRGTLIVKIVGAKGAQGDLRSQGPRGLEGGEGRRRGEGGERDHGAMGPPDFLDFYLGRYVLFFSSLPYVHLLLSIHIYVFL